MSSTENPVGDAGPLIDVDAPVVDGGDVPVLIPARMLNELAYCPRLAYLEWVDGDFADSADTVDGRRHHRRVDQLRGELPAPSELTESEPLHARSVYLSAPRAGIVAKIDLLEGDGTNVSPIDYKRGKVAQVPEGAWEPERVQLCAQAIVLEENGYSCERGYLYFVGAKKRVEIVFDEALRRRTMELVAEMRRTMANPAPPPPLVDSPKCPRCSLVGICLPDEVNLLKLDRTAPAPPRRLLAAADDAMPLYVQSGGTRIGKRDEELLIEDREGTKTTARLAQTSHVAVFGAVQISTQALWALLDRGVPVCYLSAGGWFHGIAIGMTHKNVQLRIRQHAVAADAAGSLAIARRFVAGKIRNHRTLMRRNASDSVEASLSRMRELEGAAEKAERSETLLGLEGTAARIYFGELAGMLRSPDESGLDFAFEGRNRRPPTDRVNALLSLSYAMLVKETMLAALVVGFDPYLGFYHRPRYGRPALALDLMEEFRPLIAESVVLSVVNTGNVKSNDFISRGGAVSLTPPGRQRVLAAFERRMEELVTHPIFGYRISYRRVLELQARLLARHLAGEIPEYPPFCTR